MNTININGSMIIGSSGKNITIANGRVIIDGKDVTPDSKGINITVHGNIDQLQVDACSKITVSGDAGSIKSQSGDIDIAGNVFGSVSTMSGDISCGDVGLRANTMSGDINRSNKLKAKDWF